MKHQIVWRLNFIALTVFSLNTSVRFTVSVGCARRVKSVRAKRNAKTIGREKQREKEIRFLLSLIEQNGIYSSLDSKHSKKCIFLYSEREKIIWCKLEKVYRRSLSPSFWFHVWSTSSTDKRSSEANVLPPIDPPRPFLVRKMICLNSIWEDHCAIELVFPTYPQETFLET